MERGAATRKLQESGDWAAIEQGMAERWGLTTAVPTAICLFINYLASKAKQSRAMRDRKRGEEPPQM